MSRCKPLSLHLHAQAPEPAAAPEMSPAERLAGRGRHLAPWDIAVNGQEVRVCVSPPWRHRAVRLALASRAGVACCNRHLAPWDITAMGRRCSSLQILCLFTPSFTSEDGMTEQHVANGDIPSLF